MAKRQTQPLTQIPVKDREHAKEIAKGFKVRARFPYKATATITGWPTIRPYDTIVVSGVPERELWGLWMVSRVKHVFQGNSVTAYTIEVDLVTSPALLALKVVLPQPQTDEDVGEEGGLEQEVESQEGLDTETILELLDGYLDPESEFDSDSYRLPQVYSQAVAPELPSLGEAWWNPTTSELSVGVDRAWVEVGTSTVDVHGTSTSASQVVVNLNDGYVLVDVDGVLRRAYQGDTPPSISSSYKSGSLYVIPGAAGATWSAAEARQWWQFTSGEWVAISVAPAHFRVAEAALLATSVIDDRGWLITPRGIEASISVLDLDPYELAAPDFSSYLYQPYWTAGEGPENLVGE